ncbi:MAG: twin-arginine translocation signal domain-containing protein, partial [Alphaproteobacteria bacterium]
MTRPVLPTRRAVLAGLAAGGAVSALPLPSRAQAAFLTKAIPSTGERIPVVGLGTWVTFNVGRDPRA